MYRPPSRLKAVKYQRGFPSQMTCSLPLSNVTDWHGGHCFGCGGVFPRISLVIDLAWPTHSSPLLMTSHSQIAGGRAQLADDFCLVFFVSQGKRETPWLQGSDIRNISHWMRPPARVKVTKCSKHNNGDSVIARAITSPNTDSQFYWKPISEANISLEVRPYESAADRGCKVRPGVKVTVKWVVGEGLLCEYFRVKRMFKLRRFLPPGLSSACLIYPSDKARDTRFLLWILNVLPLR